MNNATNGDDQDRVGGFPQTTASASLDSPLGGADPPDTGDDDNDNFVNNPVPEEAPPLQQHKEEEDPLEKQRRREKKEFRIVLGVAALILVVVVVIVTAVVVSHQKNEAAANQAEATPSPTPAPTSKLVQEPQAKLDYLFWDIDHNNFTKAYRTVLSEKASDMEGKYEDETQHPVTRAMSWLFDDTNDQESNLLRRLGLAALYYSNGGDDWTNKENWLSSESHCSWHGVQCCKEDDLNYVLKGCQGDARDTIVFLDLRGNNVSRNLTNVFAFLQDLRSLDLSSNALTGTLPGGLFGSMPNLFMLSLQNNDLTGTVPGGLTGNGVLDTLFLQRNRFNGTWPEEYCASNLPNFGLDCDVVKCSSAKCCPPDSTCFRSDNSTGTGA